MQDNHSMGPHLTAPAHASASNAQADLKRKRSLSHENMQPAAAPLSKTAKTHNHLQINYLARQYNTDLPLVTPKDPLEGIYSVLSDYQGVLDRHESIASNLGARPLGPILLKRFERLFEAPPRVLKYNGKEGTNVSVSWLDVVEFARNKPKEFNLAHQNEGVTVCQFYTKQCRVQISEEDYLLIKSGIPYNMIPPQPIPEDEEKELVMLGLLEESLTTIQKLADQVAAHTRQLNHRLKARSQAIMDRRAATSPAPHMRASSPSNVALMNGNTLQSTSANIPTISQPAQTSPGGFVAVNSRPVHDPNVNGPSQKIRDELMSKFQTLSDRRASSQPSNVQPQGVFTDARRPSISHQTPLHPPNALAASSKPPDAGLTPGARGPPFSDSELQHMNSPVPIPNTPSSLIPTANQRPTQSQEKDDGGLFKAEMVRRMESLSRNERIIPPCDRCRRLHMDCLKNLTACMGCTKKHAKCSWREVREEELAAGAPQHMHRNGMRGGDGSEVAKHERASPPTDIALMRTVHPGAESIPHQQPVGPHSASLQLEDRSVLQHRDPPPVNDRERDRNIEAQLQETARSGLAQAHAHARMNASDGKPEGYQAMVA